MDGAAEGPEQQEDPASKDPQSPEAQAQTRIQNLEDSLFTLQSQLQLLQSASTGAQHRPAGRPTWRRQGPRPLSQPTMEADPSSHKDMDKRTSLPADAVSMSPRSPSEPREEPVGALSDLRPSLGVIGASSEANGPCSGSSPVWEQLSLGVAAAKGVTEAKGDGVVEVVWAGLRAMEDCAVSPTGAELEAKVEEIVLEAIGDRQGAGSPELPTWVKEDRGVVEVVWEGLGDSDSQATGEVGKDVSQTSSLRLNERFKAKASRKQEGVPSDNPKGNGQGGPAGEGSFIWVERVTLGEDWEELLMEGLEGPVGTGREGGPEALLEAQVEGGQESWEVERTEAEESGAGQRGTVAKPGAGRDGVERPLEAEEKGSEMSPEPGRKGEDRTEKEAGKERKGSEGPLPVELEKWEVKGREKWEVEAKEDEEPLLAEKGGESEPPATEETRVAEGAGRETLLDQEWGGEKLLDGETTESEKLDWEKKGQCSMGGDATGGEGSMGGDATGGEKLLGKEAGGEGSLDGDATGGEKLLDKEAGGEGLLDGDATGGEKLLDKEAGSEGSLDGDATGGEKLLGKEAGGEGSLDGETKGGKLLDGERRDRKKLSDGKTEGKEGPSEVELTPGTKEEASPGEQSDSVQGAELQVGDTSQVGTPLRVEEEPMLEKPGPKEKAVGKPQSCAEGEGPPGDATPLLAETPAPELPAESQPLLQQEGTSANPSALPVPTYAAARQPEPAAPAEGEEASGPKQKTCQCCVVM
ncbi:paralemmin-3 isoform X1 [Nannospalax galili]|uniref:paralemmin-3 isoform X1 n=1 Tax=Nannospalax galili TaxID=1026970 RepID=UPI00111C7203|nr:paralemmin-3 isoform X1 [Nannospalax galili]XP_029413267.1 paralemmin-3 isoform X1 [Nannospalax galili]